jgi:threonine aldolase
MGGMAITDEEFERLRADCTRGISGTGPRSSAAMLAEIGPDTIPDHYGEGGVVAELERETAEILGKPAAVFCVSGTMAQQMALRVHADARSRHTVAFHPHCHLDSHEGRGYQRLHGLVGRPVGNRERLITIDDLLTIAEPLAALLIELPQRDLGGSQPSFDDLVVQTDWARVRGAATHLDGARLWESAAGYGRRPAEIAGLFDTVYVSFYKGLGGLPGCVLAGPIDAVEQVREWRRRHGGTLFAMWPNAASALAGLRTRLPLMPRYLEHARAIAAALNDVEGVRVLPDPPQTPMMHLLVRTSAGHVRETAVTLAEAGIRTWAAGVETGDPEILRFELSVGDGALGFTPAELAALIGSFAE